MSLSRDSQWKENLHSINFVASEKTRWPPIDENEDQQTDPQKSFMKDKKEKTSTNLKSRQTKGALVVAQLVEQSVPTPEIRSSNPDISKILSTNCTIEKMKMKKKRPGMAHL